MTSRPPRTSSRRLILTRSAALVGAASTGLLLPEIVRAQSAKVRVGFMLPYTGTFAQLAALLVDGQTKTVFNRHAQLRKRAGVRQHEADA